jgi:hypothetical protein
MLQCSLRRDNNRTYPQTQRPARRREYIPVGLLVLIRILARGTNGPSSLITFGSAQEKERGVA